MKQSLIIYYSIILFIYACTLVGSFITNDSTKISGMDSASVIFLFVVGLNSFRVDFLMFIQNGISRRSLFKSTMISFAIISFGMTLFDLLLYQGSNIFVKNYSIIEQIIPWLSYENSNFIVVLLSIFFTFLLYFTGFTAGYFITSLYYRMNKVSTMMVSVGVPAFLFGVLPFILYKSPSLLSIMKHILYVCFGSISNCIVTFMLLIVLFSGLTFLLIKRANTK